MVVAAPRPAASLVLVRDGRRGAPEVLLVLRTAGAAFMPGVWVFPGDCLERGEDAPAAAVRELFEEAAVEGVPASALVPFSHWVTPAELPLRFDTRFFLAPGPADAVPAADGRECVDARWVAPEVALECLPLAAPTIAHLRALCGFACAADLLAGAVGPRQEELEG